jgi:predicted ATPase
MAESAWLAGNESMMQDPASNHVRVGSQRLPAGSASILSRTANLLPDSSTSLEPFLEPLRHWRAYRDLEVRKLREHGSTATTQTAVEYTGENAFAVLRNWKAGRREDRPKWDFVLEGLRDAFPGLCEDIDFETAGNTVTISYYKPGSRTAEPIHTIHTAPNGLLVALLHLAAVASAPRGGILGIDEFENSLHPYAIGALLQAIRSYARQQELTVLCTTHAPAVLNEFNAAPDHVFVMEDGHETLPVRLDQHTDPDWLAHFALGDLYMNQRFGAQAPPPK